MFRKVNYFFYVIIFLFLNQTWAESCREVLEGSINPRVKAQLPNFQQIFEHYENSPEFIKISQPSPETQTFIQAYFNDLVLRISKQMNYLLHERNYSRQELQNLRHYLLKFITNKKYKTETAMGVALDLAYSELPLDFDFSFQLGFLRGMALIDDEINYESLNEFINNFEIFKLNPVVNSDEQSQLNNKLLQKSFGKEIALRYQPTRFTQPLETILELNTHLTFKNIDRKELLIGSLKNGASSLLSEIESQFISTRLNQVEYLGLHAILKIISLTGGQNQMESTFEDPLPHFINADLKKYISLSLFEDKSTRKNAFLLLIATLKKFEENQNRPTKLSLNQAFILARSELIK